MHGESVNDSQSSWPVLRSGEGLLDAGLQHVTLFDDVANVRHRAEGGVVLQRHPVRVVGNQPWIITGHLLVQKRANRRAEGLEDLPFLGRIDPLKGIEIGRMNRVEADEILQPLIHRGVQLGKALQVLTHQGLLLAVLLQNALCHDVGHVFTGDSHLLEAILDAPQAVSRKLEVGIVEQAFLNASNEAET